MPTLILLALALLIIFLLTSTAYQRKKSPKKKFKVAPFSFSQEELYTATQHLSAAVKLPTIAVHQWDKTSAAPFRELHNLLRNQYPLLHANLKPLECGTLNLVFFWEGKQPLLEPVLLAAHQDVVPAQQKDWSVEPFEGEIDRYYIWGRGSFDDKGPLIAICEAIEKLLAEGFTPQRSHYIAFGCDEEIRGSHGATQIAASLASLGLRFAYVLDEGGIVASDFLGGLRNPAAVVGIAEKQDLDVKLQCTKEGGHSSNPNNPTSAGILAKAVWRVESSRPKARLCPTVKLMLSSLGQYASFPLAIVLLHPALFSPFLFHLFGKKPQLNALIRSTCSVTMLQGSDVSNVISQTTNAVANVRLLSGTSESQILKWMHKRINERRVELSVIRRSAISSPSSVDTRWFDLLKQVIGGTFEEAFALPFLMTGGTDALNYERLSQCVYRFTPFQMNSGELKRMHGPDERLSKKNLGLAMQFYKTLIESS